MVLSRGMGRQLAAGLAQVLGRIAVGVGLFWKGLSVHSLWIRLKLR